MGRGDLASRRSDYSKPAIQSHKGFRCSSSSANARMSLSRSIACPKALFRLVHACDARITGKVESDHGNLGMYRLRPQHNGFRILNAFGASNRIGEADPPTSFRDQPLPSGWQLLRPYPISWPPYRCSHVRRGLRCGSYPLARSLREPRRIVEHSKLKIATRSKDVPLPISFQRIGDAWRKKNNALAATHVTIRKAPAVTASIKTEPKL